MYNNFLFNKTLLIVERKIPRFCKKRAGFRPLLIIMCTNQYKLLRIKSEIL